jgi:hypothetical protein
MSVAEFWSVLLALKYEAVRKVGDPTWWIL